MSIMILLTAEEANQVRGPSEVTYAALMPVELEDGRFALPVEVLDDPAHTEHHEMLEGLPVAESDTLVFKAPAEDPPPEADNPTP